MAVRRADSSTPLVPQQPTTTTNAVANADETAPAAEIQSFGIAIPAEPPPAPAKPVDVDSRNRARAGARANEQRVAAQLPDAEAITGNKDLDALLNQLPPEMLNAIKNLARQMKQMAPAPSTSQKPSATGTQNAQRPDVQIPNATAPPAIPDVTPAIDPDSSSNANANANANASTNPVDAKPAAVKPAAVKPADVKPADAPNVVTVKRGDTLSGIARKNGTTLGKVLDANPQYKPNPNRILVGDKITIPPRSGGASTDPPVTGRPSQPPVVVPPPTAPVTTPVTAAPTTPVTTAPPTTPVTTPTTPVTTTPTTPGTTTPVTTTPVTTTPVPTTPVPTTPVPTTPVPTTPVPTTPVPTTPVTTTPATTTPAAVVPAPVMERRYETQGVFAAADTEQARGDLGNRMFAQLQTAKLLPANAKLDTPLPADVQARVSSDPELAAQKPTTYGALMKSLVGDGDKNGKLDFDALQLNRVLPHASQQNILNAMNARTPAADLTKTLQVAGADDAAAGRASGNKKLVVDAPAAFGLGGGNTISDVQQQTLLRSGVIFADSNKNGKLDPEDKVSFLDKDGTIKDSTFANLSPTLQKTVKLNAATEEAARKYATSPDQVKFPSYNRTTGDNEPEAVNKDLWSIGTADVYGRTQTSWSLKDGKSPAAAIDDVVGKNAGQYTTECAQMRDVMRLKGLRDYNTNEYGKDEGTFRFNAQFPKDAGEAQKANDYIAKLDQFKKDNPGKGWSDFQAQNKAPDIKYAMQVSRHEVLSGTGDVIAPWQTSKSAGESAGGDAGYFQNHSVSVEGVRIGYVGENVLDVGFAKNPKTGDVERQFWGHPGGIQSEQNWQKELRSDDITVKNGSDVDQYFSRSDIDRNMGKVFDASAKRIDDQLKKPDNSADQVKKLQQDRASVAAAKLSFSAVTSNIDPNKIDSAKALLAGAAPQTPSDMKPLVDSLDPKGKLKAVMAWNALHPDTQAALTKTMGKDASKLTDDDKAQAALFVGLTDEHGLSASGERTLAASIVNTNAASFLSDTSAPMYSRDNFAAWMKSPAFDKWYEQKTGSKYTGNKNVDQMSQDDVRKVVELALPQSANMRTVYGRVNGGTPQSVSSQLAQLLKNGSLPDAVYAAEGTAIPRS